MSDDKRTETWTLPNGTRWPTADCAAQLEWFLRYCTPTREDCLCAAAVLAAYRDLLTHPARRDRTLAELRRQARREDKP